jgi:hypothetical protein
MVAGRTQEFATEVELVRGSLLTSAIEEPVR